MCFLRKNEDEFKSQVSLHVHEDWNFLKKGVPCRKYPPSFPPFSAHQSFNFLISILVIKIEPDLTIQTVKPRTGTLTSLFGLENRHAEES